MTGERDVGEAGGPELAAFVVEAGAELEDQIARHAVARDFAAVAARAHAIDASRVCAEQVEEARNLAAVVELRPHRESSERSAQDHALDAFLGDVRGALEDRAERRRLAGIPSPPRPRRRVAGPAIAVLGLLAASVLLVLGIPQARRVAEAVLGPTEHQAQRVELARDTGTMPYAELGPRPRDSTSGRAAEQPTETEPEPEPREVETPIIEVGPELPPAPPPAPPPKPGAQEPETAEPDDPLQALDSEALALWRQGEIARAERKFRELIERAGETDRAELAFGDLFTIAHKVHGSRRRVELWREYLTRFPSGRFADDARAGLCRHAVEDAGPGCWAAYVGDFPDGSYRAEAERAIPPAAGDVK